MGRRKKPGRDLPEYGIWKGMKDRCNNPHSKGWKYYGGRGIQVCERWLWSFDNFIADMGVRPDSSYSIERKDVDGNYTRFNCVWIPRREQLRNTRRSKKYRLGKTFPVNVGGILSTIS